MNTIRGTAIQLNSLDGVESHPRSSTHSRGKNWVTYVSQSAWSEEFKQRVINRLRDRKVRGECPMCGNRNFALLDGYLNHSLQTDLSMGMVLGGPSIPTVAIACSNCGFISEHALGALSLLPTQEPEVKK